MTSARLRSMSPAPLGLLLVLAACNTTGGSRSGSRVLDDGSSGSTPPNNASFPLKSTDDLNVVATIDSGGDWMCTGFGSLWEPSGGTLNRVDPAQHQVVAQIPASGNFCYPAPDESSMWVAAAYGNQVIKIDATTNKVVKTFPVKITSTSEGSFAVTAGGVWVITDDGGTSAGTLTRLDPNDGHVVADITVQNDSHGIAATDKSVWVTSYSGNSVTQVDIASNAVVATIPVDAGPRFIAAGESGVWALCQGTGNVAHIDPATGKLVATINANVPGGGGDITAGEGFVIAATFGKPITRIDPKTDTVIDAYQGGDFGDAVRAGAGYVWVSGGQLHQIKFSSP